MSDAVLDTLFRDFVELDALGGLLGRLELLHDVPGNSFAFTVGVGRKKDFIHILGRLFELEDDLLLAGYNFVRFLEAAFDVDPELFRKVLDVTFGGQDLVPRR